MQLTAPAGRKWTIQANIDIELFTVKMFIPAGLGILRLEKQQPDGAWVTIASTPMAELVTHGSANGNTARLEVKSLRASPGKYRAVFRVNAPANDTPKVGPQWNLNLAMAEFKAF